MTDRLLCPGGPPDFIVTGSPTVLVNGLMAARIGDKTLHGGVIVTGAPTVEIGGGTAGGTLGFPNQWLQTFNAAASGRTSGSVQQSYQNCGVESSRQLITAAGKNVTEDQLLNWALANNQALTSSAGRSQSGGTYPQNWPAITAS